MELLLRFRTTIEDLEYIQAGNIVRANTRWENRDSDLLSTEKE
jgi:hypothetical protein